jgi:hypothetical protein
MSSEILRLETLITKDNRAAGGKPERCTDPDLAYRLYESHSEIATYQTGSVKEASLAMAKRWHAAYERLTGKGV